MLGHRGRFIHKDLGKQGSEFIIEYPSNSLRSCLLPLIVLLAYTVNLSGWEESIPFIVTIVLMCLLLIKLYYKVLKESVLFLTSLGVQVETKFALGSSTVEFIEADNVKDVVILEGITMHSVICYLALLINRRETPEVIAIYPLFTHSWPELSVLQKICKTVHEKFLTVYRNELATNS